MTSVSLFLSTFALVFCLGLQSLMLPANMRRIAFAISLAISYVTLVLLNPAPDAAGIEIAAYICGGPFGIVAAIAVFRRWRAKP